MSPNLKQRTKNNLQKMLQQPASIKARRNQTGGKKYLKHRRKGHPLILTTPSGPMMPTTGLGKQIPKKSGGAYALIATTSYVMEPFQK